MPRSPRAIASSAELCALFDALFLETENTRLLAGGEEPVYLPADATHPHHRIVFRHDWLASALHEIAHWCIAGTARRQLVDYGYWYAPDGRDAAAQREFERIEARPQALEWILSEACGLLFRPSIDSLAGAPGDAAGFARAIAAHAVRMLDQALPPRAELLREALSQRTGIAARVVPGQFAASRLLGG